MTGEGALRAAATLITIGCFYVFFYTRVVARWGPLVRPMVRLLRRDRSHPAREVDAVGKLASAALAQAAFAAAMLVALGANVPGLFGVPGPVMILLGIGLGIAELGISSLVCTLALRLALGSSGGRREDWLSPGRGGWMGQFLSSARAAPPWLFGLCILMYVTGEEIVFRAIVIEAFRPAGVVVALGASLISYVGVQALHMPSARAALFPVVGGLVVGSVHGIIFWFVPSVVPLALAHATFFLGALLGTAGARSPERPR